MSSRITRLIQCDETQSGHYDPLKARLLSGIAKGLASSEIGTVRTR